MPFVLWFSIWFQVYNHSLVSLNPWFTKGLPYGRRTLTPGLPMDHFDS